MSNVLVLKTDFLKVGLLGSFLWTRAVLEKLTVAKLLNKFLVCYAALRFITVFTIAHHWTLT
jgi:hypothetical protein